MNTRKNKILLAAALFLIPGTLYAVFTIPIKLANPTPGGGSTLQDFILLLIEIMQSVLTPILVVCLIYSGYLIVTAEGNEAQLSKGKVFAFWAIIGAAIMLGASVIANMVFNTAALF